MSVARLDKYSNKQRKFSHKDPKPSGSQIINIRISDSF